MADVELKFTKKFMKFQDHKYKARLDYESMGQILVAKDQVGDTALWTRNLTT